MHFVVVIDPLAIGDVQEAIDYYDEQSIGLGKRFEIELNNHLSILEKNPLLRIRYDKVRCLALENFPFMVHFTVNENQQIVTVRAVFHTSLNPQKWDKRK
jgi:toxin ParE1/3/4